MGIRGGRRAAREVLNNRPLAVCLGGIAVSAAVGVTYLIYGLAVSRHHDIDVGGWWLFRSGLVIGAGTTGWKLKGRQRRLSVERKLDIVMDSVGRLEELLGSGDGRHLAVVKRFPSHKARH